MSKVVIVTGSVGGLSKGIAERLANDGFNVVIQDINKELLQTTEQEFKDKGYNIASYNSDVAVKQEQESLVAFAVDTFGQLDVFVNNAGVDGVSPFLDIDEAQLDKLFSINVNGVIYGTQAAVNQFIKQDNGKGKVINACSIAGHESF